MRKLNCLIFKSEPCPVWGSNPRPYSRESNTLTTRPRPLPLLPAKAMFGIANEFNGSSGTHNESCRSYRWRNYSWGNERIKHVSIHASVIYVARTKYIIYAIVKGPGHRKSWHCPSKRSITTTNGFVWMAYVWIKCSTKIIANIASNKWGWLAA